MSDPFQGAAPITTPGLPVYQDRWLSDYTAPGREVLTTQLSNAVTDWPLAQITRTFEMEEAEGTAVRGTGRQGQWGGTYKVQPDSPLLPKADAEAQLKELGLEGQIEIPETGIRQRALGLLADHRKEQNRRNAILARSPGGLALNTAGVLGTLAVSALDPINVATAFIPVVGEARYARLLASAGESVLGRTAVRAGVGAVEGAVGMAALQPLQMAAARAYQDDYTMNDALANIAFGGVFGAALHQLPAAAGWAMGKLRRGVPMEYQKAAFSEALSAFIEDRQPRVTEMMEGIRRGDLMGGTSLGRGERFDPTTARGLVDDAEQARLKAGAASSSAAKVDAIAAIDSPLPFSRTTPDELAEGTRQHAFFIDSKGHLYTASNETGGHTAGIQMMARKDGIELSGLTVDGKAVSKGNEIPLWEYQARRGLVNVTKYGNQLGIEAVEGSLTRSQIAAIGRLLKEHGAPRKPGDNGGNLLVNDRNGNEVGYFKTLAEFSKRALKKDGKSAGKVLDADFEPEVNTRKTRADAERIKQEQAKREALLADEPGLAAYAKERGISTEEMRRLLSDNHRNAGPVLADLQKQMDSAEFKSAEAAAHDRASRLYFKDLSDASSPFDQAMAATAPDLRDRSLTGVLTRIRDDRVNLPPDDARMAAETVRQTPLYNKPLTPESVDSEVAAYALATDEALATMQATGRLTEADMALLADAEQMVAQSEQVGTGWKAAAACIARAFT